MKRYLFPVMVFLLAGCASTEIHKQSSIDSFELKEKLASFDSLRTQFIRSNGNLHLSQTSRSMLTYIFPCLIPMQFELKETNTQSATPPSPTIELQGDEAIHWWKTQETFHMITPKIGFHEMRQEEIPLLTAVVCKLNLESHYDQGFLPNLFSGPKESQRGTLSYMAFIFLYEPAISEDVLIDLRRGIEVLGADSRVENAWYTRFFDLIGPLFNAGKDAMIPTKVF